MPEETSSCVVGGSECLMYLVEVIVCPVGRVWMEVSWFKVFMLSRCASLRVVQGEGSNRVGVSNQKFITIALKCTSLAV